MKNKVTNTCDKITNCIYCFFTAVIFYKIEVKTLEQLNSEEQKKQEQLQEEQERLLPWGSA